MIRGISYILIAIIEFVLVFYSVIFITQTNPVYSIKVLIVYNQLKIDDHANILEVYKSVLEEEGIPYRVVTPYFLLTSKIKNFEKIYPAVLFPDLINQTLPWDINFWAIEYLKKGGSIAVIYDAGIKTIKGHFKKKPVFSKTLGFKTTFQVTEEVDKYDQSNLIFKNKQSAVFFQIPPGKTDKDLYFTTHSYGKLKYPMAKLKTLTKNVSEITFAEGLNFEGKKTDAIILQKIKSGNLLYVNFPLGYLKSQADDLPIRSVLRTFLFKIQKIPHIINVPFGRGGLVVNWNLVTKKDWTYLYFLYFSGMLSSDLKYSFHIASGDFKSDQNKITGFNACIESVNFIQELSKIGSIGLHGGWGGKWFAKNLNSGNLTKSEIDELIQRNKRCFSEIASRNVSEYSAPDGIKHPYSVTKILEKNGFNSYTYTGDSGSAPNRTFFQGKMVSQKVIAFPVLPLIEAASFPEMNRRHISDIDVDIWLKKLLNYIEKNRTIRILNIPVSVIEYYPDAILNLMSRIKRMAKDDKIQINSLSYFAEYLLRFLKTNYTFKLYKKNLEINIQNLESLYGITIAIPDDQYEIKQEINGVRTERKNGYYYLTILEKIKKKRMYIYGKNI